MTDKERIEKLRDDLKEIHRLTLLTIPADVIVHFINKTVKKFLEEENSNEQTS